MYPDYYAVLQVAPDASLAAIESAYVRLTRQYHPDLNPSPDAQEQMRRIDEAYDVLSNPDRRATYDDLRSGTQQMVEAGVQAGLDPRFLDLIHVLEYEARSGYTDTTLIGGLEAHVRQWTSQFFGESDDLLERAASIDAFLDGYHNMSPEGRQRAVTQALARAQNRPIPAWRDTSTELTAPPESTPTETEQIVYWFPFSRERHGRFLTSPLLVLMIVVVGGLLLASFLWMTMGRAQSASCPNGCVTPPPNCFIKGNIDPVTGSKIYHVQSGEFYNATQINTQRGERWFCSEEEALANGWRRSGR